jgi:chromosome partitioning protein
MYKIIALINLKGGVGKSTTAVHLCRYLLSEPRRVALVDADAQATSSQWIDSLTQDIPRPSVYRITKPDPLLDTIPSLTENFDYIIIDGAGGLAEVQRAILLLADLVLIPIQPSFPDISASHEAIEAVRRVRKVRGKPLDAYTFLTRVTPKTVLFKEAQQVLQNYKDVPLLKTSILQKQVGADVMGQNMTLFELRSRPAVELVSSYRQLFQEVKLG